MKLVIDIPKRIYKFIIKNATIANSDKLEVAGCIMDGKKLEEYLNKRMKEESNGNT